MFNFFKKKKVETIKTKPCFCCGKTVKLQYPQYYDKYRDEEICRECYEKQNGKIVEPEYI